MVINQKQGNLSSFNLKERIVDQLAIEWHEAHKRILHKKTKAGIPITLKFLNKDPELKNGDVLYEDEKLVVAIHLIPCQAIVITPSTIMEAAAICYEIGNKHLPLFFSDNELLIPFDASLLRLLQASGYNVDVADRRLDNSIKTSVSPHAHGNNNESLFTRIIKLTSS